MIRFPERMEMRELAALRRYDRNARTHSKPQIEQIRRSIERFGFTNPVLVDAHGNIIAGHGRLAAAKLLGLKHVPVVMLEGMSEAEKRAYIIADNRLAELAGWDRELLQLELGSILDFEPEFDLTLTGFVEGELEALLAASASADDDDEDAIPSANADEPVTNRGDMWLMGEHRLLCGNAREAGDYERLLMGERAQMVITDPPYNVPVQGHVCGLGKVRHREFAMASGEMTQSEFQQLFDRRLRPACYLQR